jgi:hypothetical protein
MDAARLPGNHRTLAVEPIRNKTFEAELDVRLQEALRRRLYRTAGVELADPGNSGLVLTLEIQAFDRSRARSTNNTSVTQLNHYVAGTMTLREPGTGRVLLDRLPIVLSTSYALPVADVETPAVRDDALNDVVAQFAQAVVDRLLVNFGPSDLPPAKAPPPPAPRT